MTSKGGDSARRPVPVAIVGMACRLPGAGDVDAYWRNLLAGKDCITRFDAWDREFARPLAGWDDDAPRVLAAGLLDDIDRFDAAFFGISAGEASATDPQQRLALEVAWHCLEDAGCVPDRFEGTIATFTAASTSTYLINHLLPDLPRAMSIGGMPLLLRNDKDNLATLIAYRLGLTGPALNIGSGCSSGLAAVQLACESLEAGRCDMALCGAASVVVPQRQGHLKQKGSVYALDGVCRPFDADASGTVGASGVAFVALKRLDDALADGDAIYSTILAGGINNDGDQKLGYTAPGVEGQARLIESVHRKAGIAASSVAFVEAHATGTELGDPAEFTALTLAFRATDAMDGGCALGSVKSNIGHTDVTAGIAGLIKAALAVQHGVIPGTAHYRVPHPSLAMAYSPFFVPSHTTDWPRDAGERRLAGVTALGMGGTNVHVLLGDVPATPKESDAPGWTVLPVSAHDDHALDRLAASIASQLDAGASLAAVAAALAHGRRVFPKRFAVVANDPAEAARELRRRTGSPSPTEAKAFCLRFDDDLGALAGHVRDVEIVPSFSRAVDRLMRASSPFLGGRDWRTDEGVPERLRLALFQIARADLLVSMGVPIDEIRASGSGHDAARVFAAKASPREALADMIARLGNTSHGPSNDVAAPLRYPVLDAATVPWADMTVLPVTSGQAFLDALARAWEQGVSIPWQRLHEPTHAHRHRLPPYPFARIRHWIEPPALPHLPALADLREGLVHRYDDLLSAHHDAHAPGSAIGPDDSALAHFRRCIASVLGPGEHLALDAMATRLGAIEHWFPMLFYMVDALARARALSIDGAWPSMHARVKWRDGLVDEPAAPAVEGPLAELVDYCGSVLPAALRDTRTASQAFRTIFRDGRLERAMADRRAPYSNMDATVKVAARLVERLARDRPGLDVLEVGAGTLTFTQHLVESLRTGSMRYVISDINPVYVDEARVRCQALGMPACVTTEVLDIERADFTGGRHFDVIVALNVLHVCRDIDHALRQVREALNPGGYLIVIESVRSDPWRNLVWGLADGWWRFADRRRSVSPLADVATWNAAMDDLRPGTSITLGGGNDDTAMFVGQFAASLPVSGRVPRAPGVLQRIPERLPTVEQWLYAPIAQAIDDGPGDRVPLDVLLVFDEPGQMSVAWLDALAQGARRLHVRRGSGFSHDGEGTFHVAPGDREQMTRVLDLALGEDDRRVGVLHLWSLTSGDRRAADVGRLSGLHTLIACAQAIGDGRGRAWQLLVLTNGVVPVSPGDAMEPAHSLLQAPVKVVPLEYTSVATRLVDVPPSALIDAAAARQIGDWLFSKDAPGIVAWRDGRCFETTYQPIRSVGGSSRWRKGGCYVIFGGLGGIGRATAGLLAREFGAKLLLVGRSADDADADTHAFLRELREAGGEASVHAADVTRADDVEAAFVHAEHLFGRVHGVIHSAGVVDRGGVLQGRDLHDTERSVAAKVSGAMHIAQALRERDPDLVVFYASLGSLLYKLKFGELGYVAGNDFLSTFARELGAAASYDVRTIHWTDWQQSGMWSRSRKELLDTYHGGASTGEALLTFDVLHPMSDAEGQEVLRLALRGDERTVVVSTQPMDVLMRIHRDYSIAEYGQILEESGIRRHAERTAERAPGPAHGDAILSTLRERLRAIWIEVLAVPVGDEDGFFDLGGDSLLALRVISRVEEDLGLDLPLSVFFSASTFDAMTAFLSDKRKDVDPA